MRPDRLHRPHQHPARLRLADSADRGTLGDGRFPPTGTAVRVVPYAANQALLRWVTHDDSPALVPAMLHGAAGRNCAADTATALRCWRERDEEAREWDGIYMGGGAVRGHRCAYRVGPGPRYRDRTMAAVQSPVSPAFAGGPRRDAILDQWRTTFHMNKCGYRRGTGFVEVTDLRQGKQRLEGAPVSDFRRQEREAFPRPDVRVDFVNTRQRRCGKCRAAGAGVAARWSHG